MKEKNKRLAMISICVILFLVITPCVYVGSIYAHELSHKWDFRNIEKTNEEFCVLNNCNDGTVLGNYGFTSDDKYRDEIERISKHTEIRAYAVSLLVWTSYLLLIILIILIQMKGGRK